VGTCKRSLQAVRLTERLSAKTELRIVLTEIAKFLFVY
jgi:hypothetical protein